MFDEVGSKHSIVNTVVNLSPVHEGDERALNGLLGDYCDSSSFAQHPLFSLKRESLQIFQMMWRFATL